MAFVETAPGVHIHYKTFGDGLPVVFVHGWAMSGEVCRFHDSCSASNYRFIIPDLRGHGLSSAPADAEYSLQDLADDLDGLFTALCLDNVILAGWSMGAQVVLQAFPLLRHALLPLCSFRVLPGLSKHRVIPTVCRQLNQRGWGYSSGGISIQLSSAFSTECLVRKSQPPRPTPEFCKL